MQSRRKFSDFLCGRCLVSASVILRLKPELWCPVTEVITAVQQGNKEMDILQLFSLWGKGMDFAAIPVIASGLAIELLRVLGWITQPVPVA